MSQIKALFSVSTIYADKERGLNFLFSVQIHVITSVSEYSIPWEGQSTSSNEELPRFESLFTLKRGNKNNISDWQVCHCYQMRSDIFNLKEPSSLV
jgi:hypothetical protein